MTPGEFLRETWAAFLGRNPGADEQAAMWRERAIEIDQRRRELCEDLTSDAVVERGARALAEEWYGVGWDEASDRHDNLRAEARIVLEAAAWRPPINE